MLVPSRKWKMGYYAFLGDTKDDYENDDYGNDDYSSGEKRKDMSYVYSFSNKLVKELLKDIHPSKLLLCYGFGRESTKHDIPNEIIHYILLYAFYRIGEWIEGGDGWTINKLRNTASVQVTGQVSTIISNPLISFGKHDWKIKIIQGNMYRYDHIAHIGIISDEIRDLNNFEFGYAYNNGKFCYGFSSCGTKVHHGMLQPQYFPLRYKQGDVITVHLDLDDKTLGFSKNENFLYIAFRDIMVVPYRLAINVEPGSQHIFEFVE